MSLPEDHQWVVMFLAVVYSEAEHLDPASTDNRKLQSDMPFLLEVSRLVGREDHCYAMATYVLQRHPGGGCAFIDKHRSSGAKDNWVLICHDVLREWCTAYPQEATFGNLHHVLSRKLNAGQAAKFVADRMKVRRRS